MLLKVSSGVSSIDATCPDYVAGPTNSYTYSKIKRCLDIVIVLLAAPAVFLVVLGAAAAILLVEGGPVFFVQERVGRGGRIFKILKLRSMRVQSGCGQTATQRNDPRVTPLGRFLRQSHIDELPQLWNILVGDMTLVGPRPEQPALVEQYREKLPNYDLRHMVLPGLSGWAQVNAGYAADLAETARKLEYDLEYVSRYGPAMDLLVILRTVRVFLDPRYVR